MRDVALATVELAGHTVQVACDAGVRPGTSVRLALRGAPRFLPADASRRRE